MAACQNASKRDSKCFVPRRGRAITGRGERVGVGGLLKGEGGGRWEGEAVREEMVERREAR